MKQKFLSFLFLLLALPLSLSAQRFVNLTPKAKSMTVMSGNVVLPADMKVSYSADLPADMQHEVERFVAAFNKATGYQAQAVEADEQAMFQVRMSKNSNMKPNGYYLLAENNSVTVQAKSAEGLFYALQTVKKILPPNVMAGVKDAKVTEYVLPQVQISDEPRFEYRGFMLDVSRHFFTTDEVKRMLDVMAYYKMNRFHWHLSDDQGWRVEIKKYPKLTTIGATAPNSFFTDMESCTQYWINKPYGPYFYTQEEIKDVVAYAKERHIEIIPEIDMPGHFVAAMAAYPEYSCTPNNPPTIWTTGGISSNVLNVANPQAVQFAKDILSELIELFPYETIHIGGDECPTTQWEHNELCKARYKELKLTNYRQLQSHFIKEMADFVQSKGKKLAVWNESITAAGADLNLIKQTDALVYCWQPARQSAVKAKELGLKNIYTPWGPYYINRRQGNSPQDPPGAGYGTDDVKATYNEAIPSETDHGVQGTFWCEHVHERNYLEWLALPRLIAIAEAGWTQQARRSFADFQKRMSADTTLLNYGNYRYCKYHMLDAETGGGQQTDTVMPHANKDGKNYYYRLVSGCTDNARVGRCMELVAEGSSLITDNGAKVGMLWTNTQAAKEAANYNYQWWSLEEDPAHKGMYALVCKAQPEGSVNPNPTANNNTARWTYDNSQKHYNFVLATGAYGQLANGHYYYSITSNRAPEGWYMNSAAGGQKLSVNLYNKPDDGNSGMWQFAPMENYDGPADKPVAYTPFTVGQTVVMVNAVEGYDSTRIVDNNLGSNLRHTLVPFSNDAWTVTEADAEVAADGTQHVKLQNVATKRFIGTAGTFVGGLGRPVSVGNTATELTVKFMTNNEFRVMHSNASFYPLPAGTVYAGSNVNGATYDAPRVQGAVWKLMPVKVVTLNCRDTEGANLGAYSLSVPTERTEALTAADCPQLKNMTVTEVKSEGDNAYTVTYKRTAYTVMLKAVDTAGVTIQLNETAVNVGDKFTFNAPEVNYYKFESSPITDGTEMTIANDTTIEVVYTTDAYTGVKEVGEAVTDVKHLKNGHSYLVYDASDADNGARKGYRRVVADTKQVNRFTSESQLDPSAVWTLEGEGNKFKVKNAYYDLYIPLLQRSACPAVSKLGDTFTFTLNADGESFKIAGTNGMMWDGNENGNMVGWDKGNGHPMKLYHFTAQPFFMLTLNCVTADGEKLQTVANLHAAGERYPLIIPVIRGYKLKGIEGNENYNDIIEQHYTMTVTYEPIVDGIDKVTTDTPVRHQGIYDLKGRRLQNITQPGIYIVNGKKVLVK